MTDLEPYERLVLALADGEQFTTAARGAGLGYVDATREAKAFGWPDRAAIRQAAEDIRSEHSREESTTMQRPKNREPIPLGADVEQAMTAAAGAALIAAERVDDPEAIARWRADDVTDEHLAADVPEASTAAIDRELMADTGAILRLFDRLERVTLTPALDQEQRARAEALREAADITRSIGDGPHVADLLVLADFVITGAVPPISFTESPS